MTRAAPRWRPLDEADATATLAVFVEWLRAVGGATAADPQAVRDWPARDRRGFHAAVARFAALPPGAGLPDLLADDGRPALVIGAAGRTWTRAAVRRRHDLPDTVQRAVAAAAAGGLPALAASHLLGHDIRPDDWLVWLGDPAEPWPYGAWIAGATVVLGPIDAGRATRVFAAKPALWAD